MWADMNTATPLGVWGRSAMPLERCGMVWWLASYVLDWHGMVASILRS